MEDSPFAALAAMMSVEGVSDGCVVGKVVSWPTVQTPSAPHRVVVEGNTQERPALLKNSAIGDYDLSGGDRVLMIPIEEHQRYIIICKVVSV